MKDESLNLTKVNTLSNQDKRQIFIIWSAEYPKQSVFNSYDEFDTFILSLVNPTHYLIKNNDDRLLGWLVTIDRDGGRWLIILVDSSEQKQGIGSRLLDEMKQIESSVSAWITPHNNYFKADGTPYITPLPFYEKNGFILTDETFVKDDFGGTRIYWKK